MSNVDCQDFGRHFSERPSHFGDGTKNPSPELFAYFHFYATIAVCMLGARSRVCWPANLYVAYAPVDLSSSLEWWPLINNLVVGLVRHTKWIAYVFVLRNLFAISFVSLFVAPLRVGRQHEVVLWHPPTRQWPFSMPFPLLHNRVDFRSSMRSMWVFSVHCSLVLCFRQTTIVDLKKNRLCVLCFFNEIVLHSDRISGVWLCLHFKYLPIVDIHKTHVLSVWCCGAKCLD